MILPKGSSEEEKYVSSIKCENESFKLLIENKSQLPLRNLNQKITNIEENNIENKNFNNIIPKSQFTNQKNISNIKIKDDNNLVNFKKYL